MSKMIDYAQLQIQAAQHLEVYEALQEMFMIQEKVRPVTTLSQSYFERYEKDSYEAYVKLAEKIQKPSEWDKKEAKIKARHITYGEAFRTREHVGEILKSQNEHLKTTLHEEV